ncbi:MAG TPA: hypothetical protein VFK57_19285 [Vicinamibacterales bacterium]|nr:hypothetical protein [Vicinamibacterales bacterium]
MPRKDALCLMVYVTLAVSIGFADLRMRAYPQLAFTKFIPDVVQNSEPAPGRYRVLAPFLNHYLAQSTGWSAQNVWYATRLAWIFLAFCIMHAYLRTWFEPEVALAGVALVAASLPLTFTNSWAHPDHMPELALFTLGALAIARERWLLFAAALAAAALNRETSVFLVLLCAIARPFSRRAAGLTLAFAAEWLAIYAGLRVVRGLSHYDYWQAGRNLADLGIPLPAVYDPYYRTYAYFALIAFGPMLFIALRDRGAPLFVRRALLVVPVVALVAFLFSNIIEVRIFTPLYPLLLPAFLFAFFVPQGARAQGVR